MSLGVRIDVGEQIAKEIARLGKLVDPVPLRKRLAVDVLNLFQDHYRSLPPNRQFPGRTTHFWADAARSSSFSLQDDGFTITTNKVGVLQQYKGGTIKPKKPNGYLTIPAREEAYGKLASDFNNLRFAITDQGPALVEADATRIKIGRQKKDGTRNIKNLGETGGGVMFWLRRSVTLRENTKIIPTAEKITEVLLTGTRDHLSLAA